MKKALTKIIGIYHYKDGERVEGAPELGVRAILDQESAEDYLVVSSICT